MATNDEFNGWETYGMSSPDSPNGCSLSVTDDEVTRIRNNPSNYEYALSFKVDVASVKINDGTSVSENSQEENISTYRNEEAFLDCIKVRRSWIIMF